MNFEPKTKIKLDHLGQYYAAINSKENPGTFSVSVHLKEPIITSYLQQAVNDLMQRLPFLNVARYAGKFSYYHEVLENPPTILHESKQPPLCRAFKSTENHLIRFIYGEKYVTAEVLHSVCDGRTLSLVMSSLIARYFELLGVEVNKKNLINCNETMDMEEAEDAYAKYADFKKIPIKENLKEVYVPSYQHSNTQIITQKIDLATIKKKAKAKGLTITEYIIVHIGIEFKEQRKKDKSTNQITINVPIDCRGFFPSKSLRNFVSHKTITIPEFKGFTETGELIKKQFSEITPDYIQAKISEVEKLMKRARIVPLFIKKRLIKKFGSDISGGYTTGISNLGLIKLPNTIQDKVDYFSFALGAEPQMPYQFACAALGNTLTFTTTTTAKDTEIINRINRRLSED